ncbi:3-keto-disaccharide hydrolase [Namhaeicola litoreus]|uniref:DUF1080 domain-containing protein n=1 Tax=Namhaeicola litoreus TaxID=1052145 RepID=A0ABW3Y5B0_9FLAO
MKINLKTIILLLVSFLVGFFGFKQTFEYFKGKNQKQEKTDLFVVETNPGWTALFDGKSFRGWHGYGIDSVPDSWKIIDGVMVFKPDFENRSGLNNLVTDKEYESFILSLDWKIEKQGNSGVFWSVQEVDSLAVPYLSGPEIQILDDENHSDRNDSFKRSGALFGIVPVEKSFSKPLGEWNNLILKIDHKKNIGEVTLNNNILYQFPVNGEAWENLIAKSKFKDWAAFGKSKKGRISLQDFAGGVAFRNIQIEEL